MTQPTPRSKAKRPAKGTPDSSREPAQSNAPSQHIWLAGLGAMAKAQEQGSKAIEALINDGLALQRKSQAEAQQRMHEATERLTHLASDLGQPAARIDRLEHLFEDRVAKALHRLGIPTLADLQALNDRLDKLERLWTASPVADAAPRKNVPQKPLTTPKSSISRKPPAKSSDKKTAPPDTSSVKETPKTRRLAGGTSSA